MIRRIIHRNIRATLVKKSVHKYFTAYLFKSFVNLNISLIKVGETFAHFAELLEMAKHPPKLFHLHTCMPMYGIVLNLNDSWLWRMYRQFHVNFAPKYSAKHWGSWISRRNMQRSIQVNTFFANFVRIFLRNIRQHNFHQFHDGTHGSGSTTKYISNQFNWTNSMYTTDI